VNYEHGEIKKREIHYLTPSAKILLMGERTSSGHVLPIDAVSVCHL
jgi:hypothetical protein